MIVWRLPLLKADRKLKTIVSREGVFLVNNLVLCLIALATLTMTLWPVITRFLYGADGKHEFGEEAYVLINLPLFLILLIFTGIGPLLPYGKGSGKAIMRQLAIPLMISGAVSVINVFIIFYGGYQKEIVSEGSTIDTLVSFLRVSTQIVLPSICTLIIASSIQEAFSAGKLRQRSTKTGLLAATAGAVLNNRRRFGGYICHIGIAIVAMGIYLSSFYEIDTQAEVPQGGYAMIGEGDSRLVFVADMTESSPLYRDLVVKADIERRLNAIPKNSQQRPFLIARSQEFNELREKLQMAHELRLGDGEDLLQERRDAIEPMVKGIHSRMRGGTRWRLFLNAIDQFQQNPDRTVETYAKDMPMVRSNPQMLESLELAFKVSRSPEAFDYIFFWVGKDATLMPRREGEEPPEVAKADRLPQTSFEALAAYLDNYQLKIDAAEKLAEGLVSYEHIKSVVRIYEVELEEVSDEALYKFDNLMKAALGAYGRELQAIARGRRPDKDDFENAARQAKDEAAFRAFVDHCIAIGPRFLAIFQATEESTRADLASYRAFTKQVADSVFRTEADTVASAIERIGRAASEEERDKAKEDANALIERFGYRALGGLRFVEAMDPDVVPTEEKVSADPRVVAAGDGAARANKIREVQAGFGDETALMRSYAREKIGPIIDDALKLEPQIKTFYDKRTGSLRGNGEAVRDPQIERQLTRDIYIILQDADIKENVWNGRKDSFNYRIFVKPGMNIGLIGLLIMIFGATFALLPTRSKRGRVSVRAKRGKA